MEKSKLLLMSERNMKKVRKALEFNYNRPGVTEQERKNLESNVEYTEFVHDMISKL